jgi:hypothetical protein
MDIGKVPIGVIGLRSQFLGKGMNGKGANPYIESCFGHIWSLT